MRLISYPFRLAPNGSAVTVEQGSDDSNVEQVAVLALTRLGERPLVPSYGVPDPAFDVLDVNDLVAGVETFGPPVTIESLVVRFPTATTQEVEIAVA